MIAVVPVENVKTSIRPGLLNYRHEPRIVGTEQIGFGRCLVRRFKAFDAVCVDATAMDVAHVKLLAILLRIRIAVVPVNATIRRLLMLVADDAFDLPRERRIRASLAMVVACFCQMPQMIDHTRADEGFSFIVKRNAPRVAGAFAKHLKLASLRVNSKHRTSEVPGLLAFLKIRILRTVNYVSGIENSVQSIQPAVGSPCQ